MSILYNTLVIGDLLEVKIPYKDKTKKRIVYYLGEYNNKLIVSEVKGRKKNIVLIDKEDIIRKF